MYLREQLSKVLEVYKPGDIVVFHYDVLQGWLSEDQSIIKADLTVNDLVELTGKSRTTVRRWVHTGRLRAVKRGKEWVVSRTDYEQFRESFGNGRPLATRRVGRTTKATLSDWRKVKRGGGN
jgi:excisionase family DNA binding protein